MKFVNAIHFLIFLLFATVYFFIHSDTTETIIFSFLIAGFITSFFLEWYLKVFFQRGIGILFFLVRVSLSVAPAGRWMNLYWFPDILLFLLFWNLFLFSIPLSRYLNTVIEKDNMIPHNASTGWTYIAKGMILRGRAYKDQAYESQKLKRDIYLFTTFFVTAITAATIYMTIQTNSFHVLAAIVTFFLIWLCIPYAVTKLDQRKPEQIRAAADGLYINENLIEKSGKVTLALKLEKAPGPSATYNVPFFVPSPYFLFLYAIQSGKEDIIAVFVNRKKDELVSIVNEMNAILQPQFQFDTDSPEHKDYDGSPASSFQKVPLAIQEKMNEDSYYVIVYEHDETSKKYFKNFSTAKQYADDAASEIENGPVFSEVFDQNNQMIYRGKHYEC